MSTAGIEVRPITDMTTNRHFCEVFFTDVRVPVANLVGVEGNAFKQTMRQLEHERGGIDRLVSNQALYRAGRRARRHRRSTGAPGDGRDRDRLPHRADPRHARGAAPGAGRVLGGDEVLLHRARGARRRVRRPHARRRGDAVERRDARARRTPPATRSWAARRTSCATSSANASSACRASRDDGRPATPRPRYHFVPGASGPTIVGGDGCWLITDDGRRILDAAGGAMVVNIGHGRTVVADAVRDAIDGGAYVVPIWSTPHRERLHDRLVERWLPVGMSNVFFTSGGSESADSARATRTSPPRRRGATGAVEGRRAAPELPRHHARCDGGGQPQRSAGRVRATAAGHAEGAMGRPGGRRRDDRAGGPVDDRRLPLRADHRRRGRLPDGRPTSTGAPSRRCAGGTRSCSSPTR